MTNDLSSCGCCLFFLILLIAILAMIAVIFPKLALVGLIVIRSNIPYRLEHTNPS